MLTTLPKREREAAIFRSFLNLCPTFADEPVRDWSQPDDDPPDVLCITASARRIGVELTGWLNETETRFAVQHDRREEAILEAVGEQGENTLTNVQWVWLHPTNGFRSVPAPEWPAFRAELRLKLARMNLAMAHRRWHPHGLSSSDFSGFPTLAKHLHAVQCWPRKEWRGGQFAMQESIPGQHWIYLRARGGCYDENTMLLPMLEAIDSKRAQYSGPPGLDAFHLVIHYDRAWAENSPIETATWKLEDVIRSAREHLAGDPGPFDGIFLYLAIPPGDRVIRLV